MKFKDMKIGQVFYAWGDHTLNYNHPKYCRMEKNSTYSAVELLEKGERGVCALMEDDVEFLTQDELFRRWERVITQLQ